MLTSGRRFAYDHTREHVLDEVVVTRIENLVLQSVDHQIEGRLEQLREWNEDGGLHAPRRRRLPLEERYVHDCAGEEAEVEKPRESVVNGLPAVEADLREGLEHRSDSPHDSGDRAHDHLLHPRRVAAVASPQADVARLNDVVDDLERHAAEVVIAEPHREDLQNVREVRVAPQDAGDLQRIVVEVHRAQRRQKSVNVPRVRKDVEKRTRDRNRLLHPATEKCIKVRSNT